MYYSSPVRAMTSLRCTLPLWAVRTRGPRVGWWRVPSEWVGMHCPIMC